MNVSTSFRRTAFAVAALASFAFGPSASAEGFSGGVFVAAGDVDGDGAYRGGVKIAVSDVNYIGRDGNWFNPSNWSSGRVPGAGDNVILDGNDYVLIDGGADPSATRVSFGDLVVSSVAVLEVRNGAIVQTRSQVLKDDGQIIFRASGDVGESLIVDRSCTDCVLVQNPNQKSKRIVVLQSSVTTDMGLGGTEPATLTRDASGQMQLAAGRGHYSTLTVDTAVIDGDLKLSTYYGFSPMPGDQYQIITVNGRRTGEFIGVPEGGYVGCTENHVGLRLSYEGGDGNDIVISAEQTDPATCLLLPAVQKVREAAARLNVQARIDKLPLAAAVEQGVAQTREHILLARQIGVPSATDGAAETAKGTTKLPSPTTPISGPKPPKK
ncbi:hypothetical protein DFR24_0454 [Panacagrimonas perspica]|uniref:Uncharacterized protein n=1 Tax=Panacagrimonas perspica TaxID=381431 RepID=A0A4S3K1E4_9GAMM|nr:hypothetical protein [Panacagrimonas perspica]TDU31095.1 hypothetical protein DFR24_0454 [Panacagrimonas perspica]THD01765.1 hypothetical protein B1810_17295 [Panacagrimonas perspica]